ncbi:hypothetical protein Syun_016168 [Stephania yunnanensis]|uniref:RanBD1 domain-containing protein n=1 Tax=Stephania yunnanensis TaxID=152371 RepID=A0AAP0J4E3_9MAGN
MASTDHEDRRDEEETTVAAEDEDTGAHIAPIVKLEEVAVTTGEEHEDAILDMKAKLYRFDKDGNQWKERGVGAVKLLKHKETGKVRLVMRQSKTLKICANHLVLPTMSVQEHAGNDKSCVWHAADYADGELKDELFCIRFASVQITWAWKQLFRASHHIQGGQTKGWSKILNYIYCKAFMEKIEEVVDAQNTPKGESKEGAAASELIEKLNVGVKQKRRQGQ